VTFELLKFHFVHFTLQRHFHLQLGVHLQLSHPLQSLLLKGIGVTPHRQFVKVAVFLRSAEFQIPNVFISEMLIRRETRRSSMSVEASVGGLCNFDVIRLERALLFLNVRVSPS
jgi:hypothetical protein